jgi:predicted membrane chloride channel (bestrophin family)
LPAVVVANVFLIGMELTAKAVEDPFGLDGDDLALEKYCGAMSDFVHSALDDSSIAWGESDESPAAEMDRSSASRS